MIILSDATTFGRTTSVVGQRGDVENLGHFDTRAMNGTDGGFTAVAGTLHICFHFAETKVESDFGTILSCHLGCVGSVLFGTAEAHFAC